ncbi:MAG: energy-coupling factor transporter transmembrane protein EcfT [Oscillospiraceae bacterium]|nr:energy-coupling factor transporter transmembrane protein EcfT [Oscillospiraceae bacterium]
MLYFVAVTGIAMFCNYPYLLISSLIGAVLYFIIRNGKKHLRHHIFSVILFLILTAVNPLVSHNGVTVLFVLNDNPVTLEALLYGANASVMVLAVLYWLNSFSQVMTSEKILCIFGTVSPKISLLISMTLRFVPLLNRQCQKVSDTQKILGYYQSDNIIDSIKEKGRVLNIVVTWALENGIITANSMTARGFGSNRRTSFSIHHIRKEDKIVMMIIIILSAVTILSVSRNMMEISFYPEIHTAEHRGLYFAGLSAYAGLAILPSVLQAEASLRWKYLQSKI